MSIDPNIRAFVRALRDGKSADQAFTEYCWAARLVPIEMTALRYRGGDPSKMPRNSKAPPAAKAGWQAFINGGTDEEIAEAFDAGMTIDFETNNIGYRRMRDDERPSHVDLLLAMSKGEQEKAIEIFGVKNIMSAFRGL